MRRARDVPADGAPAGAHLFTVDVEDYFHAHALDDSVDPGSWDSLPQRVDDATRKVLRVLDDAGVTGTFFVLGWVAERYPGLVRLIAAAGHEVASHGWWHRKLDDLTVGEFREDVRTSRELLEDIVGERVDGYRAPSFSLYPETSWMLDILAEEGYRYDSSLFPCVRPLARGRPGERRAPHLVETTGGPLLELPLATVERCGLRLPAAGGAYLRHLPYTFVRSALEQAEEEERPGVCYVHPWELDPGQPRFSVSYLTGLRHYRNLDQMEASLRRLVSDFDFVSVRDYYDLDSLAEEPSETPGAGDAVAAASGE